MQLRSFPCQIFLKRYAKAFVLIVIFLKVTHHLDYLCKSPLIQASFNDLLNVKSTIRVFFFFPLLTYLFHTFFPWTQIKKKIRSSLCLDFSPLNEVCYCQQSFVRAVIACTVGKIEFQSKRS